MGDSTRVIRATACRRSWPSGHPDAAEAMLPKFRVMLTALASVGAAGATEARGAAESTAKPEAVAPASASEPASVAEHGDARLATAESASGEIAAAEPPGEPVAEPKPHRVKSARRHRKKS